MAWRKSRRKLIILDLFTVWPDTQTQEQIYGGRGGRWWWFVIDSLIMRRLVMREPQIHQLFMSAKEATACWSITEVAPASRRGAKDESWAVGRKVTGSRHVCRSPPPKKTTGRSLHPRVVHGGVAPSRSENDPSYRDRRIDWTQINRGQAGSGGAICSSRTWIIIN